MTEAAPKNPAATREEGKSFVAVAIRRSAIALGFTLGD
jgi:hypothetical protein